MSTQHAHAPSDLSSVCWSQQPRAKTRSLRNTRPAWMSGPQPRYKQWRNVAGLIDTITMEFFFAAGAHRDNKTPEEEHVPSPAQERFFGTASITDRLATIGHPHMAHRLLETLKFFIDVDPRGVFLRIAATVRAGQEVRLPVRQPGRGSVRAHRRALPRRIPHTAATGRRLQPSTCGHPRHLCAEPGWLSAHRLTYGLDEIYR